MKKAARTKHVVKFDPRDPAVVKAIDIVKPVAKDRTAFSRDVISAMHAVGEADVHRTWTALETTKDGKRAAKRLRLALQHVERVCQDRTLEIPTSLMLNPFTLDDLVALAKRCKDVERTPSAPKPLRAAEAKRDAVHHAYILIKRYVGGEISGKENGKFHRLAAVLLNRPEVKTSSLLRKKKAKPERAEKTPQDPLVAHCERYVRELNKKAETRGSK